MKKVPPLFSYNHSYFYTMLKRLYDINHHKSIRLGENKSSSTQTTFLWYCQVGFGLIHDFSFWQPKIFFYWVLSVVKRGKGLIPPPSPMINEVPRTPKRNKTQANFLKIRSNNSLFYFRREIMPKMHESRLSLNSKLST